MVKIGFGRVVIVGWGGGGGGGVWVFFFFSSRRRHTRSLCDWSSDVCSSDPVYCFFSWFILVYLFLDNKPVSPFWFHMQEGCQS